MSGTGAADKQCQTTSPYYECGTKNWSEMTDEGNGGDGKGSLIGKQQTHDHHESGTKKSSLGIGSYASGTEKSSVGVGSYESRTKQSSLGIGRYKKSSCPGRNYYIDDDYHYPSNIRQQKQQDTTTGNDEVNTKSENQDTETGKSVSDDSAEGGVISLVKHPWGWPADLETKREQLVEILKNKNIEELPAAFNPWKLYNEYFHRNVALLLLKKGGNSLEADYKRTVGPDGLPLYLVTITSSSDKKFDTIAYYWATIALNKRLAERRAKTRPSPDELRELMYDNPAFGPNSKESQVKKTSYKSAAQIYNPADKKFGTLSYYWPTTALNKMLPARRVKTGPTVDELRELMYDNPVFGPNRKLQVKETSGKSAQISTPAGEPTATSTYESTAQSKPSTFDTLKFWNLRRYYDKQKGDFEMIKEDCPADGSTDYIDILFSNSPVLSMRIPDPNDDHPFTSASEFPYRGEYQELDAKMADRNFKKPTITITKIDVGDGKFAYKYTFTYD